MLSGMVVMAANTGQMHTQTAWPILFIFGVWVGGHEVLFTSQWVVYHLICTCARAYRAFVSQEPIDRVC